MDNLKRRHKNLTHPFYHIKHIFYLHFYTIWKEWWPPTPNFCDVIYKCSSKWGNKLQLLGIIPWLHDACSLPVNWPGFAHLTKILIRNVVLVKSHTNNMLPNSENKQTTWECWQRCFERVGCIFDKNSFQKTFLFVFGVKRVSSWWWKCN